MFIHFSQQLVCRSPVSTAWLLFHLTPSSPDTSGENSIKCNQINTSRQFVALSPSMHNYMLNPSTSIACTVPDLRSKGYVRHINTSRCSFSSLWQSLSCYLSPPPTPCHILSLCRPVLSHQECKLGVTEQSWIPSLWDGVKQLGQDLWERERVLVIKVFGVTGWKSFCVRVW